MSALPEPPLDAEVLKAVLRDPSCPFARTWTEVVGDGPPGHPEPRAIFGPDLFGFVASRLGVSTGPGLEARIDSLMVDELGARRSAYSDPWTAPRRALRRLVGRPNTPRVVYEVSGLDIPHVPPPRIESEPPRPLSRLQVAGLTIGVLALGGLGEVLWPRLAYRLRWKMRLGWRGHLAYALVDASWRFTFRQWVRPYLRREAQRTTAVVGRPKPA